MGEGTGPRRIEGLSAMREPKLYERYDRSEAVALFGAGSRGPEPLRRPVAHLPRRGDRLRRTRRPATQVPFRRTAPRFCWVADKPYRVNDDKHVKFVPGMSSDARPNDRSRSTCSSGREGRGGTPTSARVGPSSMQKARAGATTARPTSTSPRRCPARSGPVSGGCDPETSTTPPWTPLWPGYVAPSTSRSGSKSCGESSHTGTGRSDPRTGSTRQSWRGSSSRTRSAGGTSGRAVAPRS